MELKRFQIDMEKDKFAANLLVDRLLEQDVELTQGIQEMFQDILDQQEIKVCDHCDSLMVDGYCMDNGCGGYYCGDSCFFTDGYTPEQWEEDYSDDGNSYWTEWETCDSVLYEKINKVISKYPQLGFKVDSKFF